MLDLIKYISYTESVEDVDTVILVKDAAFTRDSIKKYYLREPIELSRVLAINLPYEANNKVSAKFIKEYMDILLAELLSLGIKILYVADSQYFKYLTKQTTTNSIGSITKCAVKGYEHLDIIAGVNYQAIFHNPTQVSLLDISVNTLLQHLTGFTVLKAKDIIASAGYYDFSSDASMMPSVLHTLGLHSRLAIDIETWGKEEGDALRFNKSQLESIGFAVTRDTGFAFYLDNNPKAKETLKLFFKTYKGNCTYHNGLFDIKHLIYHLFMKSPDDIYGMLEGIEVMCKDIDDTMVMTYLTTNNTGENKLGLKHNTLEYTGQYAEDVKDVKKLSMAQLLEYNLKDCLATYWLYEQKIKQLHHENQKEIYDDIFIPSFKVLLETMLTGLPLSMNKVGIAKSKLESEALIHNHTIETSQIVKDFTIRLRETTMKKANAKLKKKVKPIEDFRHVIFNPGSGDQKRDLLYNVLGLPVLDLTKTKQPAVGGKTLKKLKHHTEDPKILELLDAFNKHSDVSKILTTFIKAFEAFAFERDDKTVWLNGDQILCGTVSGRLSSKNPNLANLPSGSKYGELVKSCFVAPENWLYAGADFSALEDKIVAILSDDPMKQKPFTEGIDSHCLSAYGYFKTQMPDITPENLNDIKQKYDGLRSKSKAPTFA